MAQDMIETGTADPAATAFDRLRREVTTLRLAVEQLADAPTKIDIPDYTETLTEIRAATQALAAHYRKLRDAPALAITPEHLATQINIASVEARKAERESLQSAERSFVELGRELTGFVESARTADRQNKWLVAMLVLGIAIGAVAVKLLFA